MTVIANSSWLLPPVLLFSLLVLMLATLYHVLSEIRLRSQISALELPALRCPGESTRRRIAQVNGEIAAFAVALGAIPLALYAALLSYAHFLYLDLNWMDTIYFGALSGGFVLYASHKIMRLRTRNRRLTVSYEARMAVAHEINRLMPEGYRVYHDFPTDRFHIDHIIVGPNGVFTVTTKAISAPEESIERMLMLDGRHLLIGMKSDDRSVPYAAFQASWLAKWLLTSTGEALTVHPLLSIPGWRTKTLRESAVAVVEPAAIRDFIRRIQGSRLSDKTIRQVCDQVEANCRSTRS